MNGGPGPGIPRIWYLCRPAEVRVGYQLSGMGSGRGCSYAGGMVTADLLQRSIDKIARLSGEPRDLAGYWRECTEVIGSVIPHYWTPCWYTLDPASLLATSHFHEGMAEFPAEWLANEYYGDDVNQMAHVAASRTGISTLHEATDGDPSRSRRWSFNQSMGSDQEMIARLQAPSGEVWGMLGLYREPGRPMFDATDKRFLSAASEHMKNIFDKTGVRSRRDLVGKVFFTHYEPGFRDNERRVLDGQPMRGGPRG